MEIQHKSSLIRGAFSMAGFLSRLLGNNDNLSNVQSEYGEYIEDAIEFIEDLTHIKGGCVFITAAEDGKVPKVEVNLEDRAYLCRAYINDHARFVQQKEMECRSGNISTNDLFAQCKQYRESVTNKILAERLFGEYHPCNRRFKDLWDTDFLHISTEDDHDLELNTVLVMPSYDIRTQKRIMQTIARIVKERHPQCNVTSNKSTGFLGIIIRG